MIIQPSKILSKYHNEYKGKIYKIVFEKQRISILENYKKSPKLIVVSLPFNFLWSLLNLIQLFDPFEIPTEEN
jgi:hypothetical protein